MGSCRMFSAFPITGQAADGVEVVGNVLVDDGCIDPQGSMGRTRTPLWLQSIPWHSTMTKACTEARVMYGLAPIASANLEGLWLVFELFLFEDAVQELSQDGHLQYTKDHYTFTISRALSMAELLGSHSRFDDTPTKLGALTKHVIELNSTDSEDEGLVGWCMVPLNEPVFQKSDACVCCGLVHRTFHGHCQKCWNLHAFPTPPWTGRHNTSFRTEKGYRSMTHGLGRIANWHDYTARLTDAKEVPWNVPWS